ncbi:MAG: queuosine salvage family protein [Patescibacteria group bacterium]
MIEQGRPLVDYYDRCIFLKEARRYALAETVRICQRILTGAKYVSVNLEMIKKFVADNYEKEFRCPSWKEEFIFPESDEEFVEYLGVCLASNFAFTNFEAPYGKYCVEFPEGKLHFGAKALGAALMRARSEGRPIFSFNYLSQISAEEVSWIFRCCGKDANIPLSIHRFRQMRSFGQTMVLLGYKNMSDFLSAHDFFAFSHSLGGVIYEGFVDSLAGKFNSFYDTAKSKCGLVVHFNKRANLLALMYQSRAIQANSKLTPLRDAQHIVPPADYQVPRALEAMGLIQYSDALKNKIFERKNLAYGSQAEVEIRAANVVVMCALLEGINRQRNSCKPSQKEIMMCELDSFMWFMGRTIKTGLPHHLTKTTAY